MHLKTASCVQKSLKHSCQGKAGKDTVKHSPSPGGSHAGCRSRQVSPSQHINQFVELPMTRAHWAAAWRLPKAQPAGWLVSGSKELPGAYCQGRTACAFCGAGACTVHAHTAALLSGARPVWSGWQRCPCFAGEVVFTSCGTESDSWAIWGAVTGPAGRAARSRTGQLPHIVSRQGALLCRFVHTVCGSCSATARAGGLPSPDIVTHQA